MKVIKNQDEMSACNNCLDRQMWAEVIIKINGLNVKLCFSCRKELMKKLINEFQETK